MQELEVTHELALEHGLTDEEFERIIKILGRIPSFTELGIFSVMWSEHCSYKNSIKLLKTLPRSGGRLLVEAGEENAGLVDIGDGLAVAFKIESHNHPSAVEPYQGAATGVGGIMRDVFTMGARPIASLNSLRFGSLKNARTRFLFEGVVKGIGDYGNSFGVPTVAGEVYFDESYQDNPLVNAMAVGIVKKEHVASAVAKGSGNKVMIVGSSTGRDGIHGATFASEEISEKSESKRPSVQVGDPFTEKLLLEASLEIIRNGWLVGIQDMGAAGIACSTSEMSAKGKSGMIVDLDKVPLREDGMTAYEIMLSESQERMLCVVKPGCENNVKEVFEKWDLNCEIVGEVTDEPLLKIYREGELKAEIPPFELVLGGGAPVYIRETKEPVYLKDTEKALVMKTDCNGRYVYLNPKEGTKIAVAEAARNIVCSGGVPLGVTNCLNFGNPYKPEIYWQFKQAIEGMGEACRFFDTPVTGGNVSFYNESPNTAVYPTPTIGMVGLIEGLDKITTSFFKNEGDLIYLLGEDFEELGGSEYLKVVHNKVAGDSPKLDLYIEKKLQNSVLGLIEKKIILSAHDISDGGIICAIAECCIINEENPIGVEATIPVKTRKDFSLFSESQSRIIVSINRNNKNEFEEFLKDKKQFFTFIGKTGGNHLKVNDKINIPLNKLIDLYFSTISRIMNV